MGIEITNGHVSKFIKGGLVSRLNCTTESDVRVGDRLVSIGGKAVHTQEQLDQAFSMLEKGSVVWFRLARFF